MGSCCHLRAGAVCSLFRLPITFANASSSRRMCGERPNELAATVMPLEFPVIPGSTVSPAVIVWVPLLLKMAENSTKGFDKVVWQPKILATPHGAALELSYVSQDGEEGYPGTLSVKATYTFTEDSALRLDYVATTDKDTIVNLTQHSYFNLALQNDVLNHEVMIDADKFTPVNSTLIPTPSSTRPITPPQPKPSVLGLLNGENPPSWLMTLSAAMPTMASRMMRETQVRRRRDL